MKVISTGEKIKKLRLDIGLNQEDLTNDEITRSLISMIENNKRSLTYKTAKIIANTLNQYYQNLGKEITPDYLLETETQQAERLIKEELEKMQKLLDNPVPGSEVAVEQGFNKMIQFSKEWKLNSMIAELLETRGRFYAGTYQYNKALKDYFVALELYLKESRYDNIISVYIAIGSSHFYLSLFEQALLYFIQAENIIQNHFNTIIDVEYKIGLVYYNKMLCYRKLKDLKAVLNELSRFKELDIKDENLKLKVLIIEGNTYRDLSSFEKAKKIYDRILKHNSAPDNLSLVYENYAELYYSQKEYVKSLEYINLAISHAYSVPPNYTVRMLLHTAKTLFALGVIDESIRYIKQGLLLSKKIAAKGLDLDLSIFLAKIYISTKEYDLAEKILIGKMKMAEQLSKESLVILYSQLLLIYTELGNIERCKEIAVNLSNIY